MTGVSRSRRAVVIPVKNFGQAKTRLRDQLRPGERRALAAAMCWDLFSVVSRARGIGRVFVLGNEPLALAWARQRGWVAMAEEAPTSERDSVNAATADCMAAGVRALLRLPIDIPLAAAADLTAVFAALPPAPAAVLVPSRDGTGTNALLRSPPDLFPACFGEQSFARHLGEARVRSARVRILRLPRLALDVDEWADLAAAEASVPAHSATGSWFRTVWPAARARLGQ